MRRSAGSRPTSNDRLDSPGQCGWLKDKFGLSWQVVPNALGRMLGDPDPAKSQRVGQALRQMTKLDLSALERAHAGA